MHYSHRKKEVMATAFRPNKKRYEAYTLYTHKNVFHMPLLFMKDFGNNPSEPEPGRNFRRESDEA